MEGARPGKKRKAALICADEFKAGGFLVGGEQADKNDMATAHPPKPTGQMDSERGGGCGTARAVVSPLPSKGREIELPTVGSHPADCAGSTDGDSESAWEKEKAAEAEKLELLMKASIPEYCHGVARWHREHGAPVNAHLPASNESPPLNVPFVTSEYWAFIRGEDMLGRKEGEISFCEGGGDGGEEEAQPEPGGEETGTEGVIGLDPVIPAKATPGRLGMGEVAGPRVVTPPLPSEERGRPHLVTPDSGAPEFWPEQPEEGHPPTQRETSRAWTGGVEGVTEQCSIQRMCGGVGTTSHKKGDARRRSAAVGDMAEADRVFALRLAGLITEVLAGAA